MEPKLKWRRTDVTLCHCGSVKNSHIHCPCTSCEYSAVSRTTEYNHWKSANKAYGDVSDSDENIEDENHMAVEINNTLSNEVSSCSSQSSDVSIGEEQDVVDSPDSSFAMPINNDANSIRENQDEPVVDM